MGSWVGVIMSEPAFVELLLRDDESTTPKTMPTIARIKTDTTSHFLLELAQISRMDCLMPDFNFPLLLLPDLFLSLVKNRHCHSELLRQD